MRKYFAFIFALLCSSLIALSSCGSLSTLEGKFAKSEYVLSLAQSVDVLQDFVCKGFSKDEVAISFSRDDLLEYDEGEKIYKAAKSGEGSVFASVKGQVVASTKIFVKDAFSNISNISLSNDGLLSWQESYVIYSGKKIVAPNYLLILNEQEITVDTNSYQLPEGGQYTVQIKALASDKDKVDASMLSSSKTFFFNVMPTLSNLSIATSAEYQNHDVVISWDKIDGAFYKISLDGIVLSNRHLTNSFTLNTQNFAGNESGQVQIEIFDIQNEKLSNTATFSLSKLQAPTLRYENLAGEGKIAFNNILGASSFMARVANLTTNEEAFISADSFTKLGEKIETSVAGFDFGLYQISVQAKGEGVYLNSNPSQPFTYVKLAKPDVTYKVEGNDLILNVETDLNVDTYKVRYGNKITTWQTSQDKTLTLDISDIDVGEYNLEVEALPKLVGGSVGSIEIGGINSSYVVNSDAFEGKFFRLGQIGEITHSILDSTPKTSSICFDVIPNADDYYLDLNGQRLELEPTVSNGVVNFVIENLDRFASNAAGQYVFKITAQRKDGHSTIVKADKTLQILGLANKNEVQTNGFFAWQELENVAGEDVEYLYQIYQTESDFVIAQDQSCIIEKTTSSTITEADTDDKALPFGYYVIKIYSKSKDANLYLDSDFENDIFASFNFVVEEQIASPDVSFIDNNGSYQLKITPSKFATKYDIFVDGSLVGSRSGITTNPEFVYYNFDSTVKFEDAKTYNIEVVASVQTQHGDPTLHPASTPAQIMLTRLEQPKYSVNVTFDNKGEKVSEVLSFSMIDNARAAEIYYDDGSGEVLLTSNGSCEIASYVQKNLNFTFKYTAGPSKDKNYYLDSIPLKRTLIRVAQPTQIAYNNGDITFTSIDHQHVEKYIAFVTLVDANDPSLNFTTSCEFVGTTFDVSDFINKKQQDEDFASNYTQSKAIEIVIYAYANSSDFLPSGKGTTLAGDDKLSLEKLPPSTLDFDANLLTLSWSSVGTSNLTTYYDIYIDKQLYRGDIIATSLNLSATDDEFFLTEKEVYVVAKNASYLDSAQSQKLYIRRLASIDNINLTSSNEAWKLAFNISGDDIAAIDQVLVDGQNVFNGSSSASANLPLSSDKIKIQVIAKTSTSQNRFITSFAKTFNLKNLDNTPLNARIENGKLVWDNVFDRVENDTFSYDIKIFKGNDHIGTVENLTNSQISLNDLAESAKISDLASGEYKLEIYTNVKDYTLANSLQGYFGKSQEEINLKKLLSVKDIKEGIILGNQNLQIDQFFNASKTLSWANIWTEFDEECYFDIDISGNKIQNISTSSSQQGCLLTLTDDIYTLTLDNSLFDQEDIVSIVVHNAKAISSESTSITCKRLANPSDLSVNNAEGLLSFTGSEGIDYILSYFIGQSERAELYINTSQASDVLKIENLTEGGSKFTLDLLALFGGQTGRYGLELLATDSENQLLSSTSKVTVDGTRLEGISNQLAIDDYGRVAISAAPELEQINLLVRFVQGEKTYSSTMLLKRQESNFVTTLSDIVALFENFPEGETQVSLAIVEAGSLPSPFAQLAFSYQSQTEATGKTELRRGRHGGENYIIIFDNDTSLKTTAFNVKISYNKLVEEGGSFVLKNITTSIQYLAEELKGFWIEDGYFDTTLSPDISTWQECFGLDLQALLADAIYGKISIEVSRVAKTIEAQEDGKYGFTQFKETTIEVSKLNTPEDVKFATGEKATLIWQWLQKDANDNQTQPENLAQATGYIVYLTAEGGGESFEIVTSLSLDIFAKLVPDVNYEITVQAISTEANVISSNRTIALTNRQLSKPKEVRAEDGKILFNTGSLEDLDFVSYFYEHRTDPDFVTNYANQTFKDLYTFNLSNFGQQQIRLTFTNTTNNTSYSSKVNAVDLVPDLTFVEPAGDVNFLKAIEEILNNGSQTDISYIALRSFYDAVTKTSNHGIADNKILFDDFGNAIPAGKYAISASHYSDANIGNIESPTSNANVFSVTAAVDYVLYSQPADNKDDYMARFSLVKFNPEDGLEETATRYTMVLREGKTTIASFDIRMNAALSYSMYRINANGTYTPVNGIVSAYENDDKYIAINLSALAATGIFKRSQYTIEIYANGNDYALNGKSGKFTARFLDFGSSFKFEDGSLSWKAPENTQTRIATKQAGMMEDVNFTLLTTTQNQQVVLNLEEAGNYEYIILSLRGSVSQRSINIESERYAITNGQKLTRPTLQAYDSSLSISSSSAALQTKRYQISNDQSVALEGDNNKFYTTQGTTENVLVYHPGSLNESQNQYKLNEYTAKEFYVRQLGNGGTINVRSKTSSENFDCSYVITLENQQNFIFSSDNSSLKASMLTRINQTSITSSNGDIVWQDDARADLAEGFELAYNIIVETFSSSQELPIQTQEFLTTTTMFDTSLIERASGSDRYRFTIQKRAYKTADQTDFDFVSVDGKYLKKATAKYADGSYVFASEYEIDSKTYTRSNAITGASVGQKDGKNVVMWNKNDYSLSYIIKISDLQGRVTEVSGMGLVDDANNLIYLELPDDKFDGQNPYTITIYGYQDTTLKSEGVKISNVYKLKNVDQDEYEVSFVSQNEYKISLAKYFQNNQVNNDNSVFEVVLQIDYDGSDSVKELTFTSLNATKTLYFDYEGNIVAGQAVSIPSTASNLTFSFVVKPAKNQMFNLLNSEQKQVSLGGANFNPNDQIKWHEEEKYFGWTVDEEENGDLQYLVKYTYQNEQPIEFLTNDFSFYPTKIGTITKVEVRVRANASSIFSSAISLEGNFNFDLFASGEGSQTKPYVITTQKEFENIFLRNVEGINFVLGNDITLENANFSQNFLASLDGNGKSLNLSFGDTYEISGGLNESFVSDNTPTSVNFTRYASLFAQIGTGATVKNLNVNFEVNSALTENTIFAPIALYNYGSISGCELKKIVIDGSIEKTAKNLAIGGFVAKNIGVIDECKNEFSGNPFAVDALNMIYGGICVVNEKINSSRVGKIIHCSNLGNSEFVVKNNNTDQYLAGIAVNNEGTIEQCANEGTIDVKGSRTGGSRYISGICLLMTDGTIKNSFNNAEHTYTLSSTYVAGVVLSMGGGKLEGNVDTTTQAFVLRATGGTTTSCYCSPTALPSMLPTLELTENLQIVCSDGHKIVMTNSGGQLKAVFM